MNNDGNDQDFYEVISILGIICKLRGENQKEREENGKQNDLMLQAFNQILREEKTKELRYLVNKSMT